MKNSTLNETNVYTFDEIYILKYKAITRYCYHNIKYNKYAAEDLANDIFVALYEIWDGFDPKNELTLSKWLYKTANNMVLNYNKKKLHFENTVNYDETISEGSTDSVDELSTNNISEWEKEVDYKYRLAEIKKILHNNQYKLFELSIIEGYSNSEISQMLNMKENTVKVSLHRIRAKLKKKMKK